MHHISQLTRQTPSSCYFKHTIGKRSKHCQYSLENQNQEAIWAEKQQSADNMWKHCEYSSWSTVPFEELLRTEVVLSAVTDWVLLLPLPDGFFLSVNTMIKIELLFSLCYFYSYLSCLSYLQNGSTEEWRCLESCRQNPTQRMDLAVDGWSLLCLARKEFLCGRAGERSAPR